VYHFAAVFFGMKAFLNAPQNVPERAHVPGLSREKAEGRLCRCRAAGVFRGFWKC